MLLNHPFDHSIVKIYSFNEYLKMSTICQVFYVMGLGHQTEQKEFLLAWLNFIKYVKITR